MIVFIYGTTAEAIKIAPVARRLAARGIPFQQWLTKQHTDSLLEVMPGLELPPPDRIIADGVHGRPLDSAKDVPRWLATILRWLIRNRRSLRRELPPGTAIVVHGDTMTTVVGSWIAKRLGVPSAHVEAGLRSGNWRHPFPEELDRRIAGRLVTVHYAPSEEAVGNLRGRPNVVYTHGNTAIDAVLDRLERGEGAEPYGVVLLHRFEFLSNRPLVEETMAALARDSRIPLRFFVDHFTRENAGGLLDAFDPERVSVLPKLPHAEFVGVLRDASFVVTDSGGIQAESALLGVPTLVHRMATEQREGVGENILLSGWDVEALSRFLGEYEQYRREPRQPDYSPSDIIVDDLVARGYGS